MHRHTLLPTHDGYFTVSQWDILEAAAVARRTRRDITARTGCVKIRAVFLGRSRLEARILEHQQRKSQCYLRQYRSQRYRAMLSVRFIKHGGATANISQRRKTRANKKICMAK